MYYMLINALSFSKENHLLPGETICNFIPSVASLLVLILTGESTSCFTRTREPLHSTPVQPFQNASISLEDKQISFSVNYYFLII